MEEEILALLTKGAVEQVHEDTRGFYSFFFWFQKRRGGGRRPVISLKQLNKYIQKEPFHMTGQFARATESSR